MNNLGPDVIFNGSYTVKEILTSCTECCHPAVFQRLGHVVKCAEGDGILPEGGAYTWDFFKNWVSTYGHLIHCNMDQFGTDVYALERGLKIYSPKKFVLGDENGKPETPPPPHTETVPGAPVKKTRSERVEQESPIKLRGVNLPLYNVTTREFDNMDDLVFYLENR